VKAPGNGTIIQRNVEPGTVISSAISQVSGGTVLLQMANLDSVQVRTLVDETDIGKIQPETQYSTSRAVSDSIQQLADEYQARQRAAIGTGLTTEMTEPTFRLNEANVTGTLAGEPTLAKQQLDINKLIAEAGLTGTYGGAPTEAKLSRLAQEALQTGQLTGTYGGAPILASQALTQQATLTREQMASQERLAALQRDLQLELQKGDLASREKIAQLQNGIEQAKLDLAQNALIGSAVGALATRSGLTDWLFGPAGGTAGTGGTGAATSGIISTALKKAWDLLTGSAASTPYLSTGALSADALTIAQNLVAQGFPQNIALEAANATAVEGLSPAGESLSNYLANFSNASVPAAGTGAGTVAAGTLPTPTFSELGLEAPALGPLSEPAGIATPTTLTPPALEMPQVPPALETPQVLSPGLNVSQAGTTQQALQEVAAMPALAPSATPATLLPSAEIPSLPSAALAPELLPTAEIAPTAIGSLLAPGGVGPAAPSIEAGIAEMLSQASAAAAPAVASTAALAAPGATAIGGGLTVGAGEAAVGAMTGMPALGTAGASAPAVLGIPGMTLGGAALLTMPLSIALLGLLGGGGLSPEDQGKLNMQRLVSSYGGVDGFMSAAATNPEAAAGLGSIVLATLGGWRGGSMAGDDFQSAFMRGVQQTANFPLLGQWGASSGLPILGQYAASLGRLPTQQEVEAFISQTAASRPAPTTWVDTGR